MRTETTQLKPCPFCGGEATLRDFGETRNPYIFCDGECSFVMDGETVEEAITAWNTRAERTCENRSILKGVFACTECGVVYNQSMSDLRDEHKNYCPNCGAKVIGSSKYEQGASSAKEVE